MSVGMYVSYLLWFLAAVVGTIVLGLVSKWIDRKVTAMIQWRVGPPFIQPLADIVKLLGKETLIPETAKRTGFLLAPVVSFAAVCAAAAILWVPNVSPGSGFGGDLVVVFYLLMIPSLGLMWGGFASGNPVSAMGASREMKLILAYELPFFLALIVVVLRVAKMGPEGALPTFQLGSILSTQVEHGWAIGSVSGVLAAIVAVLCIQAKLGLVPFDIAEAETELMGGIILEYSGPSLAMILLTRSMMLAVLPVLAVTVFAGGFSIAGATVLAKVVSGVVSILKYVVVIVLVVLIRNTNPRMRIDQALKFFWFFLTPIAVIAVVLTFFGW